MITNTVKFKVTHHAVHEMEEMEFLGYSTIGIPHALSGDIT